MTSSSTILTPEGIYINPAAASYKQSAESRGNAPAESPDQIKAFHSTLPSFNTTPLLDLPALAKELGIKQLLLKSESSRLGLPAFKILGASWGVYRALCRECGLIADPDVTSLDTLREHLRKESVQQGREYVLFAATEGNHGRAVARMARLVMPGPEIAGSGDGAARAVIYVPKGMYETTKRLIEGEGAKVVTTEGDYDYAVEQCWQVSQKLREESGGKSIGIMVQDNAFDGYETVPGWIVDGYSTLLTEVDEQFAELVDSSETQITHVVTPIGVGSLGHAVVKWAKNTSRQQRVRVITCEPETAACLNVSLKAGKSTVIEAGRTIMSGMCCGTVSPISWPDLQRGVDGSVTMGDWDCHETVVELRDKYEIEAGPCGAGCVAGLMKVLRSEDAKTKLNLNSNSVIVVLSTEGRREYPVPNKH